MELAILDFIQNNLRCGVLDACMVAVTHLGDLGAVWLAGALVAFVSGKRRLAVSIMVAVVLAGVAGTVVPKPLIARPRPCDIVPAVKLLVARPGDCSFPSGHAATAFAAATVLFCAGNRWRGPALVFAILIAYSRMYLYVHYPTDVLAGMLLGIVCGFVVGEPMTSRT